MARRPPCRRTERNPPPCTGNCRAGGRARLGSDSDRPRPSRAFGPTGRDGPTRAASWRCCASVRRSVKRRLRRHVTPSGVAAPVDVFGHVSDDGRLDASRCLCAVGGTRLGGRIRRRRVGSRRGRAPGRSSGRSGLGALGGRGRGLRGRVFGNWRGCAAWAGRDFDRRLTHVLGAIVDTAFGRLQQRCHILVAQSLGRLDRRERDHWRRLGSGRSRSGYDRSDRFSRFDGRRLGSGRSGGFRHNLASDQRAKARVSMPVRASAGLAAPAPARAEPDVLPRLPSPVAQTRPAQARSGQARIEQAGSEQAGALSRFSARAHRHSCRRPDAARRERGRGWSWTALHPTAAGRCPSSTTGAAASVEIGPASALTDG